MVDMALSIYGNSVAEKALLYVANYGEGYINGMAKTFGIAPSQVEKQLKRLEAAGVLVSSIKGKTRMFSINPRLGYKTELLQLLERQLSLLPKEDIQKFYRERMRPRRTGKEF
jgi:predicted transcriptional regulator